MTSETGIGAVLSLIVRIIQWLNLANNYFPESRSTHAAVEKECLAIVDAPSSRSTLSSQVLMIEYLHCHLHTLGNDLHMVVVVNSKTRENYKAGNLISSKVSRFCSPYVTPLTIRIKI